MCQWYETCDKQRDTPSNADGNVLIRGANAGSAFSLRVSDELVLVPATIDHVRAELHAPETLPILLSAVVPREWPPGEYDEDAMRHFLERLSDGSTEAQGWYNWYAVKRSQADPRAVLVGAAGYFGPPDAASTVEVGYSVLPQWRMRGYASQMLQALVQHAFSTRRVERVIAHVATSNPASVAVLRRCGFMAVGMGIEPNTFRFEHRRLG